MTLVVREGLPGELPLQQRAEGDAGASKGNVRKNSVQGRGNSKGLEFGSKAEFALCVPRTAKKSVCLEQSRRGEGKVVNGPKDGWEEPHKTHRGQVSACSSGNTLNWPACSVSNRVLHTPRPWLALPDPCWRLKGSVQLSPKMATVAKGGEILV